MRRTRDDSEPAVWQKVRQPPRIGYGHERIELTMKNLHRSLDPGDIAPKRWCLRRVAAQKTDLPAQLGKACGPGKVVRFCLWRWFTVSIAYAVRSGAVDTPANRATG